jgi:hypothetical protein
MIASLLLIATSNMGYYILAQEAMAQTADQQQMLT